MLGAIGELEVVQPLRNPLIASFFNSRYLLKKIPISDAMIERDYIMRMIQMLVQALVKIVFFKNEKDYPTALNEIQKASKTLIGVELDVIRRLTDTQIIELLTLVKDFSSPKCYLAGMLLKEEAEILELQGKTAESIEVRVKSLSLLTEAVIEKGAPLDSEHASAIDVIAGKLRSDELPVHIHKRLFCYYEIVRRFDRAEDVVYEIIEKDPSFVDEGIRFYERLKRKPDKELTEGNFSRKEIEEGLVMLRRTEQ